MGLTSEEREGVLLERYRDRGVTRASELLLPREEALRFVDDCEREGLVILGMDFWAPAAGGAFMQTGAADYSSLSGPEQVARSAAEARALLAGGVPDGGSHVSFVLD
ncbi:MAG TPA: hypothetical protein VF006_12500 [Longimicrobium sp.]